MVRGIMMTERDARLLRDLYDQVTLSFSQIHARHFAGLSKQTVNNRLTRLAKAGLIRRHRVGIVLYQAHAQEIGSVFQVSRHGIRFLQNRHPTESFREEPVRLNTWTLSHDLLLNQAMDALRVRFPQAKLIHGRLYAEHGEQRSRLPDAVLVPPQGRERWAIELELTTKSDRRYLDIVNQYRLQSHYSKVLYLVSQASIAEKIEYQLTGMRRRPGLPETSTGRFYFALLDSFLKSPQEHPIRNGTPIELAAS